MLAVKAARMKTSFLITLPSLIAMNLFGVSIGNREIQGHPTIPRATTCFYVLCELMPDNGDHLRGEVTLSGPFAHGEVSVDVKIKGASLFSGSLDGHTNPFGRKVFRFKIHRELVRESNIKVLGSVILTLPLKTVSISTNGQQSGAANGSRPIRSETNSTSSAAGSRR